MDRYRFSGSHSASHDCAGHVGIAVELKANDQSRRWGRLFHFCTDRPQCFSLFAGDPNTHLNQSYRGIKHETLNVYFL